MEETMTLIFDHKPVVVWLFSRNWMDGGPKIFNLGPQALYIVNANESL